jgi:nucleoside-diphosphate-sugar epimerase
MTRWVIVGAGYTGARVAALVTALGEPVVATRRTAGPGARAVDLAQPATLDGLFAAGDRVVVTAPPIDGVGTGERALGAAAAAAGVARLVYVSSTGVYAPAAGAWVDEAFAIAPTTAAGRARVAAEAALVASGVPLVIVRPAGIYGPDRGPIARLRAGHYRVVGDGATAVSRIHVDDLAALVVAAATAAAPAPSYNAADDDPASSAALADAAAAALGLPTPPRVPLSAVDPETVGMLTADRRIANQRAKRDLGWAPRYPSWRTALAEELRWC